MFQPILANWRAVTWSAGVLAGAVIVVNGAIYGWLLHRRRRHAADNLAA